MTSLEKIEAEAMELSADDRVILAHKLLETVTGEFSSPEIEQAWIEEAERRLEELDRGESQTYSVEEVLAEVRKRIGEWK